MNQPALKDILRHRGPQPFIGFVGKGSELTISDNGSVVTIIQSIKSQLLTIALCSVFGPDLTILAILNAEQLKSKPLFALVGLGFGLLAGWYGFLKFLLQMLGRQRLEFRKADQTLQLLTWKGELRKTLRAAELQQLVIHESQTRVSRTTTPNFTLTFTEPNGQHLDLATSNNPEEIKRLKTLLSGTAQ